MYIYNITIKVDWSIYDEWLVWMQKQHIPTILSYGTFVEYRFFRLLQVDESDGPTLVLQFVAEAKADYNRYAEIYAVKIADVERGKWGIKMLSFTSLMESITS